MLAAKEIDSARSWFQKFQTRDKSRGTTKEPNGEGKEDSEAQNDEQALSNVTKHKVSIAKQYIENRYKEQLKNLQERKGRYDSLPLQIHNTQIFAFAY